MITSSTNRLRASPYWCDDADRQSVILREHTGLTDADEVPILTALNVLGISTALLALGTPHPRYTLVANMIVRGYANKLIDKIGEVTGEDVGMDKLCYNSQTRLSLCRERIKRWQDIQTQTAPLARQFAAGAMLILLGTQPLHIRCVHAGKELFSGLAFGRTSFPPPHLEFEEYLRKQLE